MSKDIQSFIELLQNDKSLQEKMDSAVKNYTGEMTQTAIFHELILPVAQEAGFSFTEEEYQQFVSNAAQQMDLDEMDQVAGGSKYACYMGLGLGGVGGCDGLGWGIGGASGMGGSGIFFIAGYGEGSDGGACCLLLGVSA